MIKLSILPHVHVMTATCLPIGLTSLHVACVCACQNICICALCAHSHVFHKPVDVRHMHSKTDCHMYDMCVLAMMLGAVTLVQRNSVMLVSTCLLLARRAFSLAALLVAVLQLTLALGPMVCCVYPSAVRAQHQGSCRAWPYC